MSDLVSRVFVGNSSNRIFYPSYQHIISISILYKIISLSFVDSSTQSVFEHVFLNSYEHGKITKGLCRQIRINTTFLI